MSDDKTTYALWRRGKRVLLRVPNAWRVTFGPPFKQSVDKHGHPAPGLGGYTVRVYEGKLQRMAMTGISDYWQETDDIEIMEDRVTDAALPFSDKITADVASF